MPAYKAHRARGYLIRTHKTTFKCVCESISHIAHAHLHTILIREIPSHKRRKSRFLSQAPDFICCCRKKRTPVANAYYHSLSRSFICSFLFRLLPDQKPIQLVLFLPLLKSWKRTISRPPRSTRSIPRCSCPSLPTKTPNP